MSGASVFKFIHRNGLVLFAVLAPLPGLFAFEIWCLRG